MIICRECHVCDAVAAILLAIMVIGTMLPMSIYTGKILLQVSVCLFYVLCFVFIRSIYFKDESKSRAESVGQVYSGSVHVGRSFRNHQRTLLAAIVRTAGMYFVFYR